jgi:hypothetical protein
MSGFFFSLGENWNQAREKTFSVDDVFLEEEILWFRMIHKIAVQVSA